MRETNIELYIFQAELRQLSQYGSRLRKDNRGRVVLRRNKWFYLTQSVYTDSGAHQASHSISIRDSFFLGCKSEQSLPGLRMSGAVSPLPQMPS